VPQIMPREVFDFGDLDGRVEAVLDILNRLAGVATRRMREHVRTVRHSVGIERLQCRQHSRVQGDRRNSQY
jgi:hypothetical protein